MPMDVLVALLKGLVERRMPLLLEREAEADSEAEIVAPVGSVVPTELIVGVLRLMLSLPAADDTRELAAPEASGVELTTSEAPAGPELAASEVGSGVELTISEVATSLGLAIIEMGSGVKLMT